MKYVNRVQDLKSCRVFTAHTSFVGRWSGIIRCLCRFTQSRKAKTLSWTYLFEL